MNNNVAKKFARSGTAPAGGAKAKSSAKLARQESEGQRLGFLMHDVPRLRRIAFDEYLEPLGVTRSQWWVLTFLSRHEGRIQSDLAKILDISKTSLGGLIDRLEISGIVERRVDEVDRRVKRAYLTSKGAQIVEDMHIKSHDMSELILASLDHRDRHLLADMLHLVQKNLLDIKRDRRIEKDD